MTGRETRLVRASGLEALRLVTELLQRARVEDPDAGLWEAADFQWWWRTPRRSDSIEQSFWLDDRGPIAAVMLTDWVRSWGLDPIVLPGADRSLVDLVWQAGIDRSRDPDLRREPVESLIRDDDVAAVGHLRAAGFEPTDDRGGVTWMDADDRPAPEAPAPGFTLTDRSESPASPSWLQQRSGAEAEARLGQVSLHDPSLDLAIRAPDGSIAGYAVFWFDPVTKVGLLEPMRVEEAWQRRGLARSLLTNGLDRLARKGATRLKVSWGSPPGRELYLGAGFRQSMSDTSYRRNPEAGRDPAA